MHRRLFLQLGLTSVLAADMRNGLSNNANYAWHSAAPLPQNIQELYASVYQNKLFVAGGIAAKLGIPYFTNSVVSYDPITDQWQQEAELPVPLHHAALVSANQRLFVVGGFNGSYTRIWNMVDTIYELVNGEWLQIATLPRAQAEGVVATAPDGSIHIVAGQSPKAVANNKRSDHREVNTHLKWDLSTNALQTLAPIPTPRNSATGGWVNDQLVITGGRTSKGNLAATEIYDLRADEWRSAAPLPLPQAGTASVVVDDGLIVFGGEIFTPTAAVFKEVWRYSVSKDRWQALPSMPTPRHGIGAGKIGNRVYVIGGATKPSGKGTSNTNEVLVIQ